MRLGSLAVIALGVLSYALPTTAQADDTPSLQVVTTFPQNEFNVVRNGQGNRVVFAITNPPGAERVLALEGIAGAFLNPHKLDGQRGRVLRNMTTLALKKPRPVRAVGGQPLHQAFDFYSEFKPQPLDVEFRLTVRDAQTSRAYTLPVYRGQITVVEPPTNWLDPQVYVTPPPHAPWPPAPSPPLLLLPCRPCRA